MVPAAFGEHKRRRAASRQAAGLTIKDVKPGRDAPKRQSSSRTSPRARPSLRMRPSPKPKMLSRLRPLNYTVKKKELFAVVWSIEKLRPYIEGYHFIVVTDHSALKWFEKLTDPTGRLVSGQ